jgi:hypothetical protein
MDSAPAKVRQARLALLDRAQLFVVLVDLHCGVIQPSDFQPNSDPKPLRDALVESDQLRRDGWITRLEPET